MKSRFENFGNCILLEKLAAGGMAEVYLAKKIAASGVQKFVAIKRILSQFSESKDFIQMFKDEAKIAIHLSHSNIVSIYDFGVQDDQFYLVMEFVEGRNLRQILNRMKVTGNHFKTSHIVHMVSQVSAGLDHAHRCIDPTTGQPLNIIHRDMSPQNVMLNFEGFAKIVDFGIAKAETQLETTRAGTLKGKFGYMSPEQAEGQIIDSRTDIFAIGIMLWEMLAGERLFLSENEISSLKKIRACEIPSLRELDSEIPIELDLIVQKTLKKDKSQRYQTCAELHRDLQSFLSRFEPDFSVQDFSCFIKGLYSDDIVELRKKQIMYSQVTESTGDSDSSEDTHVIIDAHKSPAIVDEQFQEMKLNTVTSQPLSHESFSDGIVTESARLLTQKEIWLNTVGAPEEQSSTGETTPPTLLDPQSLNIQFGEMSFDSISLKTITETDSLGLVRKSKDVHPYLKEPSLKVQFGKMSADEMALKAMSKSSPVEKLGRLTARFDPSLPPVRNIKYGDIGKLSQDFSKPSRFYEIEDQLLSLREKATTYRNSTFTKSKTEKAGRDNPLAIALLSLSLVLASFAYVLKFKTELQAKLCPHLPSSSICMGFRLPASMLKPSMYIHTEPQGANIFINGVKKGRSPYAVVNETYPFQVGVRFVGYKVKKINIDRRPPSREVSIPLERIPTGFVKIQAEGSEILIDNLKVEANERVSVPADQDVVVRVFNPLNGISKDHTIRVKRNKSKRISLPVPQGLCEVGT